MLDRMSNQPTSNEVRPKSAASKQSVVDQIALLRSDLSGIANTVTGLAKEQLGETVGDVRDVAQHKADDVKSAIRANPMQSAAIAAGIGFALGLLMAR